MSACWPSGASPGWFSWRRSAPAGVFRACFGRTEHASRGTETLVSVAQKAGALRRRRATPVDAPVHVTRRPSWAQTSNYAPRHNYQLAQIQAQCLN